MTIKRHDGPTASGGVYAVAFYTDENGNEADESGATQCIVTEYGHDDQLLAETVSVIHQTGAGLDDAGASDGSGTK